MTFRQGFTKEQWHKIEMILLNDPSLSFNELARIAIHNGVAGYSPTKREQPIYKSFRLDEDLTKKIKKMSKKSKAKQADLMRDLIMDYVMKAINKL